MHIRHSNELHKLLAGLHAPSCSPDPQDRASYNITPGKVRTFAVLRSGECERPFPGALTFGQSKVSCAGRQPYCHQRKVSCADRQPHCRRCIVSGADWQPYYRQCKVSCDDWQHYCHQRKVSCADWQPYCRQCMVSGAGRYQIVFFRISCSKLSSLSLIFCTQASGLSNRQLQHSLIWDYWLDQAWPCQSCLTYHSCKDLLSSPLISSFS